MTAAVWLLTNKVTHARAVVVAHSLPDAVQTHPLDDLAAWRGDGWYRWRSGGPTGGAHGWVRVEQPVGWPLDLALVDATLIASMADGPLGLGSQAYQASEVLRASGEGPDDSWGGRGLHELGGRYARDVRRDHSAGPLFEPG